MRMTKKSDALITAPLFMGLSLGILTRFNVDISPSGIFKMISDALQPLMTEQHDWIIPFTLAILFVYSVLGIIKYAVDYKKTGIVVYCIITILGWGLVVFT